MASASSVSVDSLSVLERKLVVEGLLLKLMSLKRAIKATTNDTVCAALELEAQSVDSLRLKFR